MSKQERQSNIELLRILAILGVVVLHYNNPNIGGGIAYATEGGINFYLLYLLESYFVCAVDLFMLISGYFLVEYKSRNIWKVIELIAQVVIFKLATYIVKVILGNAELSIKHIISSLVPTNYFIILYCVVFLVSPFINKLLNELNAKQLKLFVTLIFVLFSVCPTMVDAFGEVTGKEWVGLSTVSMYGSQWGYSAINFMLMYCIGAFIRIRGFDVWDRRKALLTFLGCAMVSFFWSRANDFIGYYIEKSALEYCNPVVIMMAISIFIVFAKTDIGVQKWINSLAKGTLTVYLTHGVLIRHVGIEKFTQQNAAIMLVHVIAVAVGLYLVGYICFLIYDFITKPIWKFIENKIRLPKIEVN